MELKSNSRRDTQANNVFDFISGSWFEGTYNEVINSMERFGTYTCPNDVFTYRGFFQHGKFHGFGSFSLNHPYNITIKGIFKNGCLEKVEDISFGDGLTINNPSVNLNMNNPTMDFSKWQYLGEDRRYCAELKKTKIDAVEPNANPKTNNPTMDFSKWHYLAEDRRYCAELKKTEIDAVGPNAYLTSTRPARELEENDYDVEEGIYKPNAGFIWNTAASKMHHRHVSCKKEHDHIIENYRKGPSTGPVENPDKYVPEEPSTKFCKLILSKNLESMKKLDGITTCDCQDQPVRSQYFKGMCEMEEKKNLQNTSYSLYDLKLKTSAEDFAAYKSGYSSATDSSFSESSLEENMEEMLENVCEKQQIYNLTMQPHDSLLNLRQSKQMTFFRVESIMGLSREQLSEAL